MISEQTKSIMAEVEHLNLRLGTSLRATQDGKGAWHLVDLQSPERPALRVGGATHLSAVVHALAWIRGTDALPPTVVMRGNRRATAPQLREAKANVPDTDAAKIAALEAIE